MLIKFNICIFSKDTDTGKNHVKRPQVSVYPMLKPQANEKTVLLCQARCMFPNLVKFMWQAEDCIGKEVDLKDDEQLEQKDHDQGQITSMLLVDEHKAMNNKFTCTVKHDSSFDDQILVIEKGKEKTVIRSYVFSVVANVNVDKVIIHSSLHALKSSRVHNIFFNL